MSWPAAVQTLKASLFFFFLPRKKTQNTKPQNRKTNKNPPKPHIKNGRPFITIIKVIKTYKTLFFNIYTQYKAEAPLTFLSKFVCMKTPPTAATIWWVCIYVYIELCTLPPTPWSNKKGTFSLSICFIFRWELFREKPAIGETFSTVALKKILQKSNQNK